MVFFDIITTNSFIIGLINEITNDICKKQKASKHNADKVFELLNTTRFEIKQKLKHLMNSQVNIFSSTYYIYKCLVLNSLKEYTKDKHLRVFYYNNNNIGFDIPTIMPSEYLCKVDISIYSISVCDKINRKINNSNNIIITINEILLSLNEAKLSASELHFCDGDKPLSSKPHHLWFDEKWKGKWYVHSFRFMLILLY